MILSDGITRDSSKSFLLDKFKNSAKTSQTKGFKLNYLKAKRYEKVKLKNKSKTVNCKYCGLIVYYLDVNIHRFSCSFYKRYCICGRLKKKIELSLFEDGCDECCNSRKHDHSQQGISKVDENINSNQSNSSSTPTGTDKIFRDDKHFTLIRQNNSSTYELSRSKSRARLISEILILRDAITEKFNNLCQK